MPSCLFSRAFLCLVAFSLAGSLLSESMGLQPGFIAPVASLLMLGCGAAAVVRPIAVTCGRKAAVGALAWLLLVGGGVEVLGLYTHFPFGSYTYGRAWWPSVNLPGGLLFPLPLPLAWSMMAGASYLIAARWTSKTIAPLAGGLLAAIADLGLEPVMAGPLGYWKWLEPGPLPGGAPWSNFFGWFGAAALAGLGLSALGAHRAGDGSEPSWVLGGFVAFVLALGAILTL